MLYKSRLKVSRKKASESRIKCESKTTKFCTLVSVKNVEMKLEKVSRHSPSAKKLQDNVDLIKKIEGVPSNETKFEQLDMKSQKRQQNIQKQPPKKQRSKTTSSVTQLQDTLQHENLKESISQQYTIVNLSSDNENQHIVTPSTFYRSELEQLNIIKSPKNPQIPVSPKISLGKDTPTKSLIKPSQSKLQTSSSKLLVSQVKQPQIIVKIGDQQQRNEIVESGKLQSQKQQKIETVGSKQTPIQQPIYEIDLIPLHSGSKLLISKTAISTIFTPNVKNYTTRLINHLLKEDGLIICELENIRSIITHVTQVFNRRGNPVTESDVEKYVMGKLQKSVASIKK